MLRSAAIAASIALCTPVAWGQGLQATQTVFHVTEAADASGARRQILEPAAKVAPGDRVAYVLDYVNTGDSGADNVVLVMPVPSDVALVGGSTTGESAAIAFSIDGGGAFGAMSDLIVDEDGAARPAQPEEVTHVRWVFETPIAPGGEGRVGFQAVVR